MRTAVLVLATAVLACYLTCRWNGAYDLAYGDQRRIVARRLAPESFTFPEYALRMRHNDSYVRSTAAGGSLVYQQLYVPSDDQVRIRGVVAIVHGFGDSSQYFFADISSMFVAAGYAVVALDLPGCGLSDGLHAHVSDIDVLVDSAIEVFDGMRGVDALQGKPWFMFAESMGGAIATLIARKQRTGVWGGMILSAPMVAISDKLKPPQFVIEILRGLAHFWPTLAAVPTKGDIVALSFRDPQRRALALQNRVAYRLAPRLATGLELLATTEELASSLHDVTLPFLLLHGREDVITDPLVSQRLFDAAVVRDKTLNLYEGAWHALLAGEPMDSRMRIWADVKAWLDARS